VSIARLIELLLPVVKSLAALPVSVGIALAVPVEMDITTSG
jgi:hypothetical protein